MAMEIHPPIRPIRSVKEFLLHLLTITCGILIALGLQGIVERTHHRHAARDARTNLAREAAENYRGLALGIERMEKTQAQLQAILKAVRELEADRTARPGDLALDVSISGLSSTAWNTAATTGALGHMEREDVELYTKLYDLQQQFMTSQQRALESLLELESYGALLQGPLTRITDAQGIEAERAAGRALAATHMAEDIGKALEAEYRKLLAGG